MQTLLETSETPSIIWLGSLQTLLCIYQTIPINNKTWGRVERSLITLSIKLTVLMEGHFAFCGTFRVAFWFGNY